MSKHVIIVHGTYGSPDENWFPWLKQELEALGYTVTIPLFPTPGGQSLEIWKEVFGQIQTNIDEDTILVGHSLGAAFLLHVIESLSTTIPAAFFVSGFIGFIGNETFDTLNSTFVSGPFDWEQINAHCNSFYVLQGTDDPYVGVEKGKELTTLLNAQYIAIKDGGHLNADAGFTTFPMLLDLIKNEL